MNRLRCLATTACLLLAFGCSSSDIPPTSTDITMAMSREANSARVDHINDLSCENQGPSKFFCTFEITYIGQRPTETKNCFFEAGAKWIVVATDRCF